MVISLGFDVETLARTRLSLSPVMEAVSWLKLAATARRHPVFGDPGPVARAVLRHPDVALIADLMPSEGATYVPDLLFPKPTAGSGWHILDAQLAQIESTGRVDVDAQVCHLIEVCWGHPVSHRIRRLADSGRLPRRLAAGVAHFWKETLDAEWPSLRTVLDHDITERAKMVAAHGIRRVLGSVHPRVGWTGDTLTVESAHNQAVDLSGHEFVLAPTALSWPGAVIQIGDRAQATLYYPANRIGNGGHRGPGDLSEIMGAVRAALLADLATARSTGELAARHGVSASTASYHLGALHRARLVTKHRDGRHVLYQRTDRAATLMEIS